MKINEVLLDHLGCQIEDLFEGKDKELIVKYKTTNDWKSIYQIIRSEVLRMERNLELTNEDTYRLMNLADGLLVSYLVLRGDWTDEEERYYTPYEEGY